MGEELSDDVCDERGGTNVNLENYWMVHAWVERPWLTFDDVVTASRYVTDLSEQDFTNEVWAEYFGESKPATTTVQVVQLATDPRCLIEINAIVVV